MLPPFLQGGEIMEAVLWEIIEFGCEWLVSYAFAEAVKNGVANPDENTKVEVGDIVAGVGYYNFVNSDNQLILKSADYSLSSKLTDNYVVIDAPDFYYSYHVADGTAALRLNSYYANNGYALQLRGYYSSFYFNGEPSPRFVDSLILKSGDIPVYEANNLQSQTGYNALQITAPGVKFTTVSGTHNFAPDAVYLPISGQNLSYNEIKPYIVDWYNNQDPSETITIDDLPTWEDILYPTEETETESNNSGGECGCGDTYIYVNADGSLTLNNDISGDMPINIDNNADLSLSINAATGAFGAGAIVVDPDANINLNAGAFGASAFGAGAITGDINFSGDVTFEQSGEITNNYYYIGTSEPTEPQETEQPFTIDYDEILSEGELESILNQETYVLMPIETNEFTDLQIVETLPGEIQNLPAELVVTSNEVVNYGSQIVSDLGLTPVYAPLLVFSFVCYVLRGCA